MDRRNGDRTLPLLTPTMAGGLFSIDRDYFYKVGAYDTGMDIWGMKNDLIWENSMRKNQDKIDAYFVFRWRKSRNEFQGMFFLSI